MSSGIKLAHQGTPTRLIRQDQSWEGDVIEAPTLFHREGRLASTCNLPQPKQRSDRAIFNRSADVEGCLRAGAPESAPGISA